jgi:hypothetical protein
MKHSALMTLILLGLIVAVGVTASDAQDKGKLGDKGITMTLKQEVVKLDDTEGHVLALFESKRYDLDSGSVSINNGVSDVIKGNGVVRGYFKFIEKDGDILLGKFDGKVTTTTSGGKPVTTGEGTWSSSRGTGKWQNRQATGTYKSKVAGEGVSVTEWEGSWEVKR